MQREVDAALNSPERVRREMRERFLGKESSDSAQQTKGSDKAAPARPAAAQGAGQLQPGATATNPKTGERIQWDGKQWLPL
jgi:hypothetical protein